MFCEEDLLVGVTSKGFKDEREFSKTQACRQVDRRIHAPLRVHGHQTSDLSNGGGDCKSHNRACAVT